ncbi:MAG: helix-turn-helix transcriptional regulator [Leptospiraceae bacterium]|nr:helix-turn-helix transcriptional regulator [Leptospiraceae bacterium]
MELIHAAGITQSLLLGLYFLHRRREAGNLLESILLFVVGATILVGYLYGSGLIVKWPHLSRIGFTLMSLIGPLFLLSSRARSERPPVAFDLLWFLVPLGITLYLIPFHLSSAEFKAEYLKQDLIQIHFDCVIILYFSLINNLLAMARAILLLYRRDKSSTSSAMGTRFIGGRKLYYFLPLALLLAASAVSITDPNLMNSGLFSAVGSLIVLGRSYVLLYNRETTGQSHEMYPPADRYRKSLLAEDLVQTKGKEIEDYLNEDSPYLEPDFQLSDLARRLELSNVQTSQIINRFFEMSFLQLVQKKRVEQSLNLLKTRDASFTILDIAMESGFNSKSAFNAAFRKITGLSPTEYRNENQKRSVEESVRIRQP